ncbi:NAD-dependent epimerase/dehydratase family protein [Caulobacter segnis]
MANVIVFGASGFIGTRLVRRLAERGVNIVAVDILPPREILSGVRYISHDVRQAIPEGLGLEDSVVYNFAAVHRTPGHPAHEYYDTNIFGALNVTQFADTIGAKKLVFTSSISVYGPREDVVDESTPPAPTSDYGRSKLMAESIHRKWADAAADRRLVIVRPGVVFGPGEKGNYSNLAGALKRGLFAYPGRKDTIKSGGYVDELLNALDYALSRQLAEVTFNFAYPSESTTEDIVKTFGRVSSVRTKYPVLPIAPLLAVAWGFEVLTRLGFKTPIHRERIWKLVRSTRIAPNWLVANGYVFSTDMESALKSWCVETAGKFD